ncbi:treacle protein [Rhinophrynus dorsalis]
MKEADGSLLALIHQHLLQAGYSKAARVLQSQSGKKFPTQCVSLREIYDEWTKRPENTKKRKAIQANETPSKKVRVPDPESSSEASEEEDEEDEGKGGAAGAKQTHGPQMGRTQENKTNAKQLAVKQEEPTSDSLAVVGLQLLSLSVHETPADPYWSCSPATAGKQQIVHTWTPVKTASSTAKNMNAVKSTASKAKGTPQINTTTVQDKPNAFSVSAAVNEGGGSSDIKEGATPLKAAPIPATLKSDPGIGKSSDDSSSSESETETAKPAIVATPVTKAAAAPTTPHKVVKGKVPPKPLSTAPTTKASSKGETAVKAPPPESSDSSDSEEETVVPVTPSRSKGGTVSNATKLSGTPAPLVANKGKVVTQTKTPVPAQLAADESSEDSDSSDSEEEEPQQKKTAATLPSSRGKTGTPSTATKQSGTPAPKTGKVPPPSKTPVPAQPAADESSETSDSSDSEEETPQAKKTAATLPASRGKTGTPSTATKQSGTPAPKTGKVPPPSKAPVPAQPAADESSETSDSSDSEEETPQAKKTVATLPASQGKTGTPSTATKQSGTPAPKTGKVPPPSKTPVPAQPAADESSETSDSSDSEEETPQAKTPAPLLPSQGKAGTVSSATKPSGIPAPLLANKRKVVTPAKTPIPVQLAAKESSESSDSSDSEEEEPQPKAAAPLPASQGKSGHLLTTPKKSGTPAQLLANKGKNAAAAKTPLPAQQAADTSDSSSDSDEEEVPQAKTTVAPLPASQGKTGVSSTAIKSPVTPASHMAKTGKVATPAKTPVPPQQTGDESSDDSDSTDSEEEESEAKTAAPLPASHGKSRIVSTTTKLSGTPAPPFVAKTGKSATPAKTSVPAQQAADESSDTSGSSDSEEESQSKKTAARLPASQGKSSTPSTATKPSGTPIPKKGKVAIPAKTPVPAQPAADESSSASDSSDSEEEESTKAKVVAIKSSQTVPPKASTQIATSKVVTTLTASQVKGKKTANTTVLSSTVPLNADSSETSESSDDEDPPQTEKLNTPLKEATPAAKSAVQQGKAAKGKAAKGKTKSPAKTGPPPKLAVDESSNSSDSSDSEEEAMGLQTVLPTPEVRKMCTRPMTIESTSPNLKTAKGKATVLAPTSAVKAPPPADMSDSSDTTDIGEEDANQTVIPAPAIVKPVNEKMANKMVKTFKPSSLKSAKGKAASPAKTAAPVIQVTGGGSDSSDSSESEEEQPAKVTPLPTLTVGATLPGNLKAKGTSSSPAKIIPALGSPAAEDSSGVSSSDSEGELTVQTPSTPLNVISPSKAASLKTAKSANFVQGKFTSPTPTPTLLKPLAEETSESSDSTDIDEDPGLKNIVSAPVKVPSGQTSVGHLNNVSGDGTAHTKAAALSTLGKTVSSSEDTSDSDLEDSQNLLIPPTPLPAIASTSQKRKRALKTMEKTTPAPGEIEETKKKKSKAQPMAAPVQPALATVPDSEEETIMALLEGRSPKKANQKKSTSKKKVNEVPLPPAPTLPIQDINVAMNNGQSANEPSQCIPESPGSGKEGKDESTVLNNVTLPVAVNTPGLLPQSAEKVKKSGKKRKLTSEEAIAKKKAKLERKARKAARKERREKKKLKLAAGEGGDQTPKTKISKKDKAKTEKSDKKKKEKSDKKKKDKSEKKKKDKLDKKKSEKTEKSDKTKTEKSDKKTEKSDKKSNKSK